MLCRQGCFPCFSKVSWLYLTLRILPSPSFMLFYFHFSSFSSFSASVCSENIYSHLTYSLQELTDSLYPNLFQQLDSPPRVSPLTTTPLYLEVPQLSYTQDTRECIHQLTLLSRVPPKPLFPTIQMPNTEIQNSFSISWFPLPSILKQLASPAS